MAIHYSKYSSVLEIEKTLLGIELTRVGKMLTKSQMEKKAMKKNFENYQTLKTEESQELKKKLDNLLNENEKLKKLIEEKENIINIIETDKMNSELEKNRLTQIKEQLEIEIGVKKLI